MFNGIWLVATEPLTVQGREIKAGERFHLSRVHSGALLVTGRATIAHPQPAPKTRTPEPPEQPITTPRRRRRTHKTEEVAPSVEPPQPAVEPQPQQDSPAGFMVDDERIEIPARRYHRRDLEAEE